MEENETISNESVQETKEKDSISLHSTPSLRFEPVEEHKPSMYQNTVSYCRLKQGRNHCLLSLSVDTEVQGILSPLSNCCILKYSSLVYNDYVVHTFITTS